MSDGSDCGRLEGTQRDLDLLFRQLEQLRELTGDPESAEDGDRRYDFSIRWGVLLSGRLQRLVYYDSRNELSRDEKLRFDELSAQLRDVAPLAEHLGMADPTAALRSQGQEAT